MLHKNLPELIVGKIFFGQIAPSHREEAFRFWMDSCGICGGALLGVVPGFMKEAVVNDNFNLITCQFTKASLQKIYENTEKSQKSVIFSMDIPIETKFIFHGQMNTANVFLRHEKDKEVVGYRLFDSAIIYNGFRYAVVCPELDEIRKVCKKCLYCGAWQDDENEEYHLGCADRIKFQNLSSTKYNNVLHIYDEDTIKGTPVPDYVLENFKEKNHGK